MAFMVLTFFSRERWALEPFRFCYLVCVPNFEKLERNQRLAKSALLQKGYFNDNNIRVLLGFCCDELKLTLRLQKDEYLGRVADSMASKACLVAELRDPTPDVYKMFVGFDKRFFWGKLAAVEVKWSSRMTRCAGLCQYRSENGACSIHLSLPLLKLRPRKDFIDTLLHEMIHAYLFVTHNKDRDGHGREFCSHMNRINREAGTNITIYHSFHDEVNHYKTHWWKCNGKCQTQEPFYGIVRRATNRAPCPNDLWWTYHQQTCGGTFIKIREPENYKAKGKKNTTSKTGAQVNTINNYFLSSKFAAKHPCGGTFMKMHEPENHKAKSKRKATSKTEAPVNTINNYFPSTAFHAKHPKYIKTVGKKNNVPIQGNENLPSCPSQPVAGVIPFSGKGFVIGTPGIPSLSEKPWLKRPDAEFVKMPQNKRTGGTLDHYLQRLDRLSTSIETFGSDNNKIICSKTVSGKEDCCSEPKVQKIESSESDEVSRLLVCPVPQNRIEGMSINEHVDMCLNTTERQFPVSGEDETSEETNIFKEYMELITTEIESDFSAT